MQSHRALVIHPDELEASLLIEELEQVGVPADRASDERAALEALRDGKYRAVLLDDELPGGGSLTVYDALDALGPRRPAVVMVSVPPDHLAEVRAGVMDGRVEYVATPETQAEAGRLALRIRARLVNAGLAEEFGEPHGGAKQEEGSGGEGRVSAGGPGWVLIAVVLSALALLLLARIFQRTGEDTGLDGALPSSFAVTMRLNLPAPPMFDTIAVVGAPAWRTQCGTRLRR